MSVRSNARATIVEDYYSSDEEQQPRSDHNTPSPRQQRRNSLVRNTYNNSYNNRPPPVRHYESEEEDSEEEDMRRAMHDFGLEDARRYDMMYSPGGPYFMPPPPMPRMARYEEDPYYMHPPPPPPRWQQYPPSPRRQQMYSPQYQHPSSMDLPFIRRSASSRSYNNNNRHRPSTNQLPSRRNQEIFVMPHDEDHDANQDYAFPPQRRPSLSRTSSMNSNGSRSNRKRRTNSLSLPPQQQHFNGRGTVHSEPNSPQHSSDSVDEEEEMYYRNRPAPLGRRRSFQGLRPHMTNMPPPPPPPVVPQQQAPPPMILHPPPMPHPNIMENPLLGMLHDPMMNNQQQQPQQQISPSLNAMADNGVATPGSENQLQMPWMPMMQQPQMPLPMMGLNPFNNLMPQQNNMWNFMNQPQQDMFFNDIPLPFMNLNDANLLAQTLGMMPHQQQTQSQQQQQSPVSPGVQHNHNEGNAAAVAAEEELMMRRAHAENEMMIPPPMQPEQPMLRRGLSLLGGLFGSHKKGPAFMPPHMFNSDEFRFTAPIQSQPQTKKEMRKAQQYQKLGSVWCWRRLDSPDGHFESFNLSNQKIIKRKSGKGLEARSRILLGREKKLPGDIMVDLNEFRGGCMISGGKEQQFIQLVIKEELFDGNNSFVFSTPDGSSQGNGPW